ncbi:MAG: C-terminal target protein [Bacteroidetes bacterium]|jgi:hypothetical protein|nr:C-terminal target protein [Bacteroidota bacterium]
MPNESIKMKKTILLLLLTCITGFTVNAQNNALLWAKSVGSSAGTDIGLSVAVDVSGNVYTTGYFTGTVDFDPGAGSFPLTAGGNIDMYVSKLDASGNFVWAVAMGSTGYDQGNDIAVDASGNVYVSGYFQATVDFDPGAGSFPLSSAGGTDIMVVKLDAAGSFVWAKAMGGTGDDTGQSITLDASANVYSTGSFGATVDFDPGAGLANLTSAGNKDIFVSKLDFDGNFVWARRNGSTGNDQAMAIAVDASANVYMGGSFNGTVDFDPGAGTVNLTASGQGLFVYKLNTAGTFVWARNTGNGGSGETQGLALDASGNIYTTGYFAATVDFDPGAATVNLTAAGAGDIFLSKLDAAGIFVWAKNIGGTSFYPSHDVAVDLTGNVYITGYFSGTIDFDPGAGTVNLTAAGNNDIFIVSFTAAGDLVWAKQQGSTSADYGYGITTDASQNVYVTGTFNGTVDFDDGSGITNLTSLGGAGDMYIQKIGFPPGAALNFDGADDKVTVPANTAFNFTTGTVECWFNSAGSADNESVACMRTAVSNTRWSIHVNESTNEVGIYNGVTYLSVPAGAINPNTWYHLACVMTPGNTTFYLNGILAGSVNAGIVTSFTGIPVCIGSVNDVSFPNENFTGTIDEVRIWNTARTSCEINTYKNCEIASTATGLIANYHFNQGAATTANPTNTTLSDVSGNSNTGSLTGFALSGTVSNWVAPGAVVSGYTTPDLVSGATVVTAVSCFGGSNGVINLTPSGGTAPYSFNWGGGITTEDRTAAQGTYTVTITDANSCTGTVTATVTQPAAPVSGTTVVTNIACFGGSTGILNLTPSGGTTPYTFNWGSSIITEDRSGLTAGTYTVIITDGNSCTGTVTATVTQPAAPVSGTTVITNACFGTSNGAINLTPAGGTPGYTVMWEDLTTYATWDPTTIVGALTLSAGNLHAATTSGNTQNVRGTIGVNSGKWYWENTLDAGGNHATMMGVINTGTGTRYTYYTNTGLKYTNLTPSSYSILSTTGDIIGVALDLTGNQLTFYKNGVSMGLAFTLPAGTYKPYIYDASASANLNINITSNFGQTAFTSVPTGFNPGLYSGTSTEDRSGLTPGTYNVTILDTYNCTATLSATITEPSAPLSGTTVVTNASCFGGSNGAINLTPADGTGPYTFNWGSGITTEDRTGLAAGTYTVIITDASGCTETVTETITEPASPVSGTTVETSVSCFGGSNGAINLTPAGGTGPYTFNWLPSGPTTEDRTGLVAGTYSVQIIDINGCVATVTATVNQPTAPVSGTTVVTNVSCFGGSNGAINLTPNGGTGPYTFNWLPSGPNTEDRTGLVAGTYSVQVIDINGCVATVTATVNQPIAPVSGTTVVTNVSCFGGSNGAINLTPTGGTGPYTFNWLPSGPTTEDRTGLVAGIYTVQVIDVNGCVSTVTASVTQPTSPVSGTTVVTNVSCFGGSNGAINLTPTGGTFPYTFNWLPSGPATEDRTGLVAGTYSVQITDLNGCVATVTASVTQPTMPVSGTTVVSNVSCFGGSNGAINLTPSGGSGSYTFNWLPSGPTTEDRTGLVAGTYSVQITDLNGCVATVTASVTQPTTPVSGTTVVTNVSCFGGSNGAINLTPTGGSGSYTFNWLPSGPTTEDRTGLVAGTYSVQITDINGCVGTVTATVTQPTTPVSGSTVVTNVSCFGGSNGAINLTPSGGSGSYTFTWLPSGPTTEDRTGLIAGTYSVQITDLNGCVATVAASVTQPTTPVSGTTVVTNISCFGGSNGAINLTPSGGSGSYTFNWLPSGPTTEDRTGLVAGTYSVQITDINGCVATVTPTVNQPPAISFTAASQTNVSCFGGSNGAFQVNAATGGTGGFIYDWAPGNPTGDGTTSVSGLTAGTWTVTATDANACSASINFTITEPSQISFTAASQTNVSCFGGNTGAFEVNAAVGGTGGFIYDWSPGNPTGDGTTSVSGLTAGTWTVTATDVNACSASINFTITEPSQISFTAASQTNVSCFGGSNGAFEVNAAVGGTGAFTYDWTPGNPTGDGTTSVSGLTAGTWTVTATDVNACSESINFTITEPSAITSTLTVTECDAYTLNATTYTANGIYTQVLTGASSTGCDSTITLNLTILQSTASALSAIACDSYTLNGATYNTSGVYTQSFTNAAGCDSTLTLNLTVNQPTASTMNAVACSSYTLNGTTYTTSGVYTQNFTNAAGCDSTLTLNLTVNQPTASTVNATACSSYTLNGTTYTISGVYTQNFTNAAGCDSTLTLNLTVSQPTASTVNATACSSYTLNGTTYTTSGVYTQNFTNAAGCDSTLTLNLTVNQPSTSTLNETACGSFTLNGTTYTSSGTYTQTLMNIAGCDSMLTLNLTLNTAVTHSQTFTLCAGQSITVGPNTYTATGIYSDVLTAVNGCDSTITTNVIVETAIDVTTSTVAETITATATGAGYQWLDCDNGNTPVLNETNQSFTATANGNYAVIVMINGCSDTSACMSITTIGIRSLKADRSEILIMPNPNTGTFTVKAPEGTYYLINELGQQIKTIGLNTDNNYSVRIDNLGAGVYYLIGKDNSTRNKIVVTD